MTGSFEWDVRSACYPIYNARVKFYKNGHILMADFCFGCDIMELLLIRSFFLRRHILAIQ